MRLRAASSLAGGAGLLMGLYFLRGGRGCARARKSPSTHCLYLACLNPRRSRWKLPGRCAGARDSLGGALAKAAHRSLLRECCSSAKAAKGFKDLNAS